MEQYMYNSTMGHVCVIVLLGLDEVCQKQRRYRIFLCIQVFLFTIGLIADEGGFDLNSFNFRNSLRQVNFLFDIRSDIRQWLYLIGI